MKKLRSEVVDLTIQPAIDFIKSVKAGDRVAVIHDDDADGICSGVITALLIKKICDRIPKIIPAKWHEMSERRFKENVLIFLDIPRIADSLLVGKQRILIIDHHPPVEYKNAVYCNPRNFEPEIYLPVSYLVYKIYENFFGKDANWIAAVGTLGDYNISFCRDLFDEVKKDYPELIGDVKIDGVELYGKSLLGKLVEIVESGTVRGDKEVEIVVKVLLAAKNYKDILSGCGKAKQLLEWREEIKAKIEKLTADFKRNSRKLDKNIIFYRFSSKLNLKSVLITQLQNLYIDKIIVVGQDVGEYFHVGIRKGKNVGINLADLVTEAIAGIPEATGGGHPDAVGARIPKKYAEMFLNNLVKLASVD